jgi:anti-anti-sigma factor
MLCCSEDERHAATLEFVRTGLGAGEKVAYVAEDGHRDSTERALAEAGSDLAAALADERLSVQGASDTYVPGGRFDADATIGRMRDDIAAARASGFSGYRIAAEMQWALSSDTDGQAVINYEQRVDTLLHETGTAALCQYDHRRFDRDTARMSERVHHLVLAERDEDGGAPCELLVERGPEGETVLRGEADGPSCDSLTMSLTASVARSDQLRLDVRDLSFIGAAGLRAIRDTAEAIAARGGRLTLVSPRPVVRQIVGLMGFERSVTIEAA